MFLDASVIIAAVVGEPEAMAIKTAMLDMVVMATSPIAIFESSCRLARLRGISIEEAHDVITEFLKDADVALMSIDAPVSTNAHLCASRYHRITGHPARLNLGDCFAYAAAKRSGLKLAYKGNDFIHTDVDGIRFGA